MVEEVDGLWMMTEDMKKTTVTVFGFLFSWLMG